MVMERKFLGSVNCHKQHLTPCPDSLKMTLAICISCDLCTLIIGGRKCIQLFPLSSFLIWNSNAIGPLIGLWIVGVTHVVNSKMPIPIWLLIYGGIGISIGLCVWGRRVIQTLGEDLARITPSR